MQAVGLNHQVLGMFGYLAATCLLVEWMFGGGGVRKKAALTTGMSALAAVACFEGSAWSLFLLGAATLLVLECIRPGGRRLLAAVALVVLVLLPAWIGHSVASTVLAPAAEANPESINGGSLAFMARGWDFEWGGEYSDTLQTLDVLTLRTDKDRLFKAYLAGQCAYNGRALVTKLFPAKLAKFMLAGYASMAEEVLWANEAGRTARMVRGMRTGWFVLLYAPLMLCGLWRLARRVEDGDGRVAWLVLPVALFGVAVMFAGETSPRYSMPVQALLLAAGTCGWVCGRKSAEEIVDGFVSRYPFAMGMLLLLVGYGMFAVGILGLRGVWCRYALADMRSVALESGHPVAAVRLAPFEAVFPEGEGSVEWVGFGGSGAVYLHGVSWRERAKAEVEWGAEGRREVELPARLVLDWTDGEPRRLAFRRVESTGPLRLGYAEIRSSVPRSPDGE